MLSDKVIIMRVEQSILATNIISRLGILEKGEHIFRMLNVGNNERQIDVLQPGTI